MADNAGAAATGSSTWTQQSAADDMKMFKELLQILRDAADFEARNQEQNSQARRYAERVRAAVEFMTSLVETEKGRAMAGGVMFELAKIFQVFGQFLALQGPVAPLLAVAAALLCSQDANQHNIKMGKIRNHMLAVDKLEKELNDSLDVIGSRVTKALDNVERVLKLERWLPAEVDRLRYDVKSIETEIKVARKQFTLLKEWIKQLGRDLTSYEQEKKRLWWSVWAGTTLVSGAAFYTGRINGAVAALATIVGGVPLLHYKLTMSHDVADKLIKVHRKELHLRSLNVKLDAYDMKLQRVLDEMRRNEH